MGRRRFTVASSSGQHHDLIGLLDDDHTQYLLVDGSRSFTGSLTPSGADTLNIGSATRELLNLYMGDAGFLYFGLAQDISLYRSAANVLRLGQDDFFRLIQSAIAISVLCARTGADSFDRLEVTAGGRLYFGSGATATDVLLFRGAADRLDLAGGDNLNLVFGDILLAADRLVDGVDPSKYTKFALQWHAGDTWCAGGDTFWIGTGNVMVFEKLGQFPVPEAATAVTMYVQVHANTLAGATTVTLKKNGAATAITLTIAGGATGTFSDTAHSVAFAAGDLAGIEITTGADGLDDIRVGGVTVKFAQSAA